jgi:cytochrome d ubiquinol oxidase subunit I
MRTATGASPTVEAGQTIFTLLGFAGLYALLGIGFLLLVVRQVILGPESTVPNPHTPVADTVKA